MKIRNAFDFQCYFTMEERTWIMNDYETVEVNFRYIRSTYKSIDRFKVERERADYLVTN